MTRLACSFFSSALDVWPKPWEGAWEALSLAFGRDRNPRPHSAELDAKRFLPAISGATYAPGSTRGCVNVQGIQLAILDFDNTEERPDPLGSTHRSGRPILIKRPVEKLATIDLVCDELSRLGITGFAWSTWSSTIEWPRFRLVIPLSSAVTPALWPSCTEWLLGVSGLTKWRNCIDLPVLRDVARLHFLPARRPGGPLIERHCVRGEILSPPAAEALTPIVPPRPELQPWQIEAQVKQQRRGFSIGGNDSWARRFKATDGTLLDLRTLDAVRLLAALGCRVGMGKGWGRGTKHRTSCPWFLEHTNALDDDSGVLFLEPGRWPSWHCSHSHHAHLGLADLLEAAGVLHG
jgi:hypothetical protein